MYQVLGQKMAGHVKNRPIGELADAANVPVPPPSTGRVQDRIKLFEAQQQGNGNGDITPPPKLPSPAILRARAASNVKASPPASGFGSSPEDPASVPWSAVQAGSSKLSQDLASFNSRLELEIRSDHWAQGYDTSSIYPNDSSAGARIQSSEVNIAIMTEPPPSADGGVIVPMIADLLRTPEDLEKIPALKAEFMRKKADVDARLREGLEDQIRRTQSGMASLSDARRVVEEIKEEMRKIHDMCEEAQDMRKKYPQIDFLAKCLRNFSATIAMKEGLMTFREDVREVQNLLLQDEDDIQNQPNLLEAHMKLTKLRDFRDEALDQVRKANLTSEENLLLDLFEGLDAVIDLFDAHVGQVCMNLIPLVQEDNKGMVVRLAVVIANEEKNDDKVRALQDARKDHEDLVAKFQSFTIGPKTIRGYKEKFLEAIEAYAQNQFDATANSFIEDPDKLEKLTKWFFNDLLAVQRGMQSLMPKKWHVFRTYTGIYHRLMHDFLLKFIDDEDRPATVMLSIVHWIEKYYSKMQKLGHKQTDLTPHVLDDREAEIVREWRNIIIKTVNEWTDRMFETDRKAFMERNPEALDHDANEHFRTKTLGDLWRMLREQISVAAQSERVDVVEGVLSAMFVALKQRQTNWQHMIDDECRKYSSPNPDAPEGLQVLQDWLVAVANDQIACIDDNDDTPGGSVGYLTRFKQDFQDQVSQNFLVQASVEIDSIRDGYVDLSTHCITSFVSLIFTVDFKTIISDFFVERKWPAEAAMKRITTTFDDYMSDYATALHPSLLDVLVEELGDELLIRYLSSVRNRGVKFRRADQPTWTTKFRQDVVDAFEFFAKYPDSFVTIKPKWRVVDYLVRLLEADKLGVVETYGGFKQEYWDLHLSWVESALRSREDYGRDMMQKVKAKAADIYVDRTLETIMGKVK